MNNNSADNGIPILTEVLALTATDDVALNPVPDTAAQSVTLIAPAQIVPAALPSRDEPIWQPEDWARMEADISQRVTLQVLGRIDFILEQRVRDSLADVLQVAVAGLAQEIRHGLQSTLEDVIARAVAQEFAVLQKTKKK